MQIETNIPLGIRNHVRDIDRVAFIVLHRISLENETAANPNPVDDDVLCGRNLFEAFENKGLSTGGLGPYHELLRSDNVFEQCLPFGVSGSHAGGYNQISIGVAIAGNWDLRHMPQWMYDSAVEALAPLAILNDGLVVVGHCPELKKSRSNPNKRCPGQFVDTSMMRHDIEMAKPDGWSRWTKAECRTYIEAAGFVF